MLPNAAQRRRREHPSSPRSGMAGNTRLIPSCWRFWSSGGHPALESTAHISRSSTLPVGRKRGGCPVPASASPSPVAWCHLVTAARDRAARIGLARLVNARHCSPWLGSIGTSIAYRLGGGGGRQNSPAPCSATR